uniref:hypothetical protein n=1 Tax=Quadrisphaera sp. RL12-1S TaxID=2763011 RepID=UPI001C97A6F8|nr:hypothetical protein [Quadrisphaera sp. RL12-1S]
MAVLDVRLPDGDGVAVCRELRSRMPDLCVPVITSNSDDEALGEPGGPLAELSEREREVPELTTASHQHPTTATADPRGVSPAPPARGDG